MFNVIKTRAAVSILECVTSFIVHSCKGLLEGQPAPGVDLASFLSNSRMKMYLVLTGLLGEKLEDMCKN